MGSVLPSTSIADTVLGANAELMRYLQEKRAWQSDRGVQGNLSLSILRYIQSGGKAYYLVEPSYVQVSGLSNLPCFFDDEPKNYEKKFGSIAEEATAVFILYDVTDGISVHDIVVFDSVEYTISTIWSDAASGRYELLTELLKDT